MSLIKRIVKEVLLVPKNVAAGAWEALDETINGPNPDRSKDAGNPRAGARPGRKV